MEGVWGQYWRVGTHYYPPYSIPPPCTLPAAEEHVAANSSPVSGQLCYPARGGPFNHPDGHKWRQIFLLLRVSSPHTRRVAARCRSQVVKKTEEAKKKESFILMTIKPPPTSKQPFRRLHLKDVISAH